MSGKAAGALCAVGQHHRLPDAPTTSAGRSNFYDNLTSAPTGSAVTKAGRLAAGRFAIWSRQGSWQVTVPLPRASLDGWPAQRSAPSARHIIRQFVLHHDGCATSADCFECSHDERGLSAHFLVDNNGWIYQTLDLSDGAFHASGVNEISIGVEPVQPRPRRAGRPAVLPQSAAFLAMSPRWWSTTPATACGNTPRSVPGDGGAGQALARLFPNLPQVFPEWNGQILNTWMADPRVLRATSATTTSPTTSGDPGCFDFAGWRRKSG